MLLLIQLLIVGILALVLAALYIDERRTKYETIPVGKMTEYWNGSERREHVRVNRNLIVRYIIEKKPRISGNALTKNIGSGGILLETNEKLTIETLLGLEIEIPDHRKPVIADGKVVWVKENPQTGDEGKRTFDTGIKFVDMERGGDELLHQYINGKSRASRSYKDSSRTDQQR